jgi:hypothetical protein
MASPPILCQLAPASLERYRPFLVPVKMTGSIWKYDEVMIVVASPPLQVLILDQVKPWFVES